MQVRTKVIPFKQGDYQCYIGIGEPKLLAPILKVDYHEDTLGVPDVENGYQRPATPSRVKAIAEFREYLPRELFPTALFLSCREKMVYDEKNSEIVIDSDTPVFIIDGNHRFEGTKMAMGHDIMIGNIPLPFVLVENISREKEMEMFVVINGEGLKSVDTALCLQILSMQNVGKPLSAIDSKMLPKSIIIQVVNKLTSTAGSPWYRQISTLSAKYGKGKDIKTMVGKATSMVESLVTVYRYMDNTRQFQQNTTQTQEMQVTTLFNIVTDFWNAVREVNPTVFGSPLEYGIQRSSGQYALHMLLTDILADIKERGESYTRSNFARELSGYDLLTKTDFWLNKAEDGKVGIMVGSGSKAYRSLYAMLVASNPAAAAKANAAFAAEQAKRQEAIA